MFFSKLFSQKLLKPKQITVDNAISRQIFNKKLSKEEILDYFKDIIYHYIGNSINYGSDERFIAIKYPYFLDDAEILEIENELTSPENGYLVDKSKKLGYFIVSWNHKYYN